MNYYSRQPGFAPDGSPIFATKADKESEEIVRAALIEDWEWSDLVSFPKLFPIDFYGVKDDLLVGLVEVKTRYHERDHYPTVFLNIRKHAWLSNAAIGLAVPAFFVVRFTDWIGYTEVSEVPVGKVRLGGCSRIVKAYSDIEPVIEVPIESLSEVETTPIMNSW